MLEAGGGGGSMGAGTGAVDAMMGGMFVDAATREQHFGQFLSALDVAELEKLQADLAAQAETKRSVAEFLDKGEFPDAETLSNPKALLEYLRGLNGPVVPTKYYKAMMVNPENAMGRLKTLEEEKYATLCNVARQVKRYKARGKDYRRECGMMEDLEKEILKYVMRPTHQPKLGGNDDVRAMRAMRRTFKQVEKEDADAGREPEPEPAKKDPPLEMLLRARTKFTQAIKRQKEPDSDQGPDPVVSVLSTMSNMLGKALEEQKSPTVPEPEVDPDPELEPEPERKTERKRPPRKQPRPPAQPSAVLPQPRKPEPPPQPAPAPAPTTVRVCSSKSDFKLPTYQPAPPSTQKRHARPVDPVRKVGPTPLRVKKSFAPATQALSLLGRLPQGYDPIERAGTPGQRFVPVRPDQLARFAPVSTLPLHADSSGGTSTLSARTSWRSVVGINSDLIEYDRAAMSTATAGFLSERVLPRYSQSSVAISTAPDDTSYDANDSATRTGLVSSTTPIMQRPGTAPEQGSSHNLDTSDTEEMRYHPAFEAMDIKTKQKVFRRVGGSGRANQLLQYPNQVVIADTRDPQLEATAALAAASGVRLASSGPGSAPVVGLVTSVASDIFQQAARFEKVPTSTSLTPSVSMSLRSAGGTLSKHPLGGSGDSCEGARSGEPMASLASDRLQTSVHAAIVSARSLRSRSGRSQRSIQSTVCYQAGHDGVPSLLSRNGRPCSSSSSLTLAADGGGGVEGSVASLGTAGTRGLDTLARSSFSARSLVLASSSVGTVVVSGGGTLDTGTALLVDAELSTVSVLALNSRGELRQELQSLAIPKHLLSKHKPSSGDTGQLQASVLPSPLDDYRRGDAAAIAIAPEEMQAKEDDRLLRHTRLPRFRDKEKARQLALRHEVNARNHVGVYTVGATATDDRKPSDSDFCRRATGGPSSNGDSSATAMRALRAELPRHLYGRRCVVPGPSRGFSVVGLGTGYINL